MPGVGTQADVHVTHGSVMAEPHSALVHASRRRPCFAAMSGAGWLADRMAAAPVPNLQLPRTVPTILAQTADAGLAF